MPTLSYQLTAIQINPASPRRVSVRLQRLLDTQGIGEVWVDLPETIDLTAALTTLLTLASAAAGQTAEVGGLPLTVAAPPPESAP